MRCLQAAIAVRPEQFDAGLALRLLRLADLAYYAPRDLHVRARTAKRKITAPSLASLRQRQWR